DESCPDPRQAAAVDSILFMRDPFKVTRIESWLSLADPNTHVLLFVTNLQLGPGETPSNIVVTLVDDSGQVYEVPAEDFRPVPNTQFMQIMFRLPDTLHSGTWTVRIKAHGQISNRGTFRIK